MNRSHSAGEDKEKWLRGLHPKQESAFNALPKEHQLLVLNGSEKFRKVALRTLDYMRRGINGRNQWVNGLEQLQQLLRDRLHPLMLMVDGKTHDVEAMLDILIDFNAGEHANTKNTDPFIYSLIAKASDRYKDNRYDLMDVMGIVTYFEKHPECRPLRGRYPDEQQIAQREALRLGVKSKILRKRAGMTQEQLAAAVGSCTKTIKNLEAGQSVSSHTLLMTQNVLSRATNGQTFSKVKLNKNTTPAA
jgi:DNA-binding XRE family transcriptional regulator